MIVNALNLSEKKLYCKSSHPVRKTFRSITQVSAYNENVQNGLHKLNEKKQIRLDLQDIILILEGIHFKTHTIFAHRDGSGKFLSSKQYF